MTELRKSVQTKDKINVYWKQYAQEHPMDLIDLVGDHTYEIILEDEGTRCYACGCPTKHLQRCHIVPKSAGGSNENSNIFLMCEPCHSDNPDTVYPEFFFLYVKNRESFVSSQCRQIKFILDYLQEKATPEEISNFNYNASRPLSELTKILGDNKLSEFSSGLMNKLSVQTAVVLAWKNITKTHDLAYIDSPSA